MRARETLLLCCNSKMSNNSGCALLLLESLRGTTEKTIEFGDLLRKEQAANSKLISTEKGNVMYLGGDRTK